MKIKRKTITITQEDINNGSPLTTVECPAALALSRAFGKPMWVHTSFGVASTGHPDYTGNAIGKTPRKLLDWIMQFDRSHFNNKISKPQPAKFIITYKV